VRLASLRLEPSAEDEADVKQILGDIRKDIVEHKTTFADAATTWSEDPSAKQGGDLGFFDRQRMVAAFADVAFALPIGEVSEPVRTQFGLHLITVTDEKLSTPAKRGEKPERTEVRASHILLRVHPSQTTLVSLRERADAALQDAPTSGIEAAAQRHGLQFATTPAFQESMNLPGVQNSISAARFAFANPPGTLSPVYQTDEAVYFFEVAERLPEGTRTLDEVRTQVIGALQREARAQKAAQALAPPGRDPGRRRLRAGGQGDGSQLRQGRQLHLPPEHRRCGLRHRLRQSGPRAVPGPDAARRAHPARRLHREAAVEVAVRRGVVQAEARRDRAVAAVQPPATDPGRVDLEPEGQREDRRPAFGGHALVRQRRQADRLPTRETVPATFRPRRLILLCGAEIAP